MAVALLSVGQTNPSLREVLFAVAVAACNTPRLNPDFAISTPDEHKWLRNHALEYFEREDSLTLSYRIAAAGLPPCISSLC